MTTRKDLARDAILEAIPAIAAAYHLTMTDDMIESLEADLMFGLECYLESIGIDPDTDEDGNRY